MVKKYEYKEAKEMIDYYHNLLNELNDDSLLISNIRYYLMQNIQSLLRDNFFSHIVSDWLNDKTIDLINENSIEFITRLFKVKKADEIRDKSNRIIKEYRDQILKNILCLSKVTNIISWLFSSKDTKK